MIRYEFKEEESSMGRMDIFDKFRITFDEQQGWVDFEEGEKAQSKEE